MILVKDSLEIILLGDWNRLYTFPDWIAPNVFKANEIEICLKGQGNEYNILCRYNGVTIYPAQNRFVFKAEDTKSTTLHNLVLYVNRFLTSAFSPSTPKYELNCMYVGEDKSILSDVIDSLSDSNLIIESGYKINTGKVSRTLVKGELTLNVEMALDGNNVVITFNGHQNMLSKDKPEILLDQVVDFLNECKELISVFGYDPEEDDL